MNSIRTPYALTGIEGSTAHGYFHLERLIQRIDLWNLAYVTSLEVIVLQCGMESALGKRSLVFMTFVGYFIILTSFIFARDAYQVARAAKDLTGV